MTPERFDLRDLRSAILREDFRRDLQGSYDGLSRRWHFASRLARDEARAACEALPFVVRTFPNARDFVGTIRAHGGFDIIGQHESGGIRSPHRTVVFRDVDARINAEQALFRILRASDDRCATARDAATDLDPQYFALPEHQQALTRLRAGLAWRHDADLVIARAAAARATTPPSEAARRASRDAATAAAKERTPDFSPAIIEPTEGTFYGTSLARAEHHVALRDERTETDVLLDRSRLVLPLSQRTRGELLPLYFATLHVRFENGLGRALQSRERDPDLGAVTVCAMRMAADLDVIDILHTEEFDPKEDLDATYVTSSGFVASALDHGATAIIGRQDDLTPDGRGRVLRDHTTAATRRGSLLAASPRGRA